MQNYQGKLLVAHPNLKDGLFVNSVIYLYQDNPTGSLGIVLNKPTTWRVKRFLEEKNYSYEGTEVFYKGGPVNENAVVLLHTNEWYSSNTIQVGNGLAISSDTTMLEKMSMGNSPKQWRIFSGVAAWAPRQLELEMRSTNGWQIAEPDDCSIVFDRDGERQWNSAVQLCSKQLIDQYI
jgi:putative transcriptional regulator